jgi:hypothetical protein
MIPKLIIETGPTVLPLLLQCATVNVKLLHPGFEYRFFDDSMVEAFIEDRFPEYQGIYRSFRFRIQRYDFFRYLAIYQYGGFYLDLDVFLARDLSPLLASQCVFPFEELTAIKYLWNRFQMDWQIGNYAFGAVPGHPFLAAIIENCLRASKDPSWVEPMMKGIPKPSHDQFYVLNTTGPGLISRTLAENPEVARSVAILFPDDVRDRRTWHQFGSYGVHHMVGSWRKRQNCVSLRLTRLWEGWTLRRILTDSRDRGKTRERGMQPPIGDTAG